MALGEGVSGRTRKVTVGDKGGNPLQPWQVKALAATRRAQAKLQAMKKGKAGGDR
jgi:hypothetical protein